MDLWWCLRHHWSFNVSIKKRTNSNTNEMGIILELYSDSYCFSCGRVKINLHGPADGDFIYIGRASPVILQTRCSCGQSCDSYLN